MSGPIPNLQFQPYNPMDTAIQTALGVFGAGMQGQKAKADTDIQKYILQHPYLLGGEQAKDIGSLMAMMGQSPNPQMMTGAGNPYGMPGQNEQQSQPMPATTSPYGGQQQQPMPGMPTQQSQSMVGGQPLDMDQLIQQKIQYALSDPASQQALIAERSAQATLPYQAYLAQLQNKITTEGSKGVKQFDTANDLLASSSNISGSAKSAEASINKFEKSMKQINPLLNAPIVGGLIPKDWKASGSVPYQNAQNAANALVLEWAPVMNRNGILTNDSLALVQGAKLNPDSPRAVSDEVISIMRPASKRLQEMNPFMNYAIKDLNIDPQNAESLWLEYNQSLPVDPFLEGGSEENLGKYRDFLNASQGIRAPSSQMKKSRLTESEMDQKISGALSVDPELLSELKRRGLVK